MGCFGLTNFSQQELLNFWMEPYTKLHVWLGVFDRRKKKLLLESRLPTWKQVWISDSFCKYHLSLFDQTIQKKKGGTGMERIFLSANCLSSTISQKFFQLRFDPRHAFSFEAQRGNHKHDDIKNFLRYSNSCFYTLQWIEVAFFTLQKKKQQCYIILHLHSDGSS